MTNARDELRSEYGEEFWKGAVRGKYTEQYAASEKVVRLAPDVAASFPNDESVNEALRSLLKKRDDVSQSTSQRTEGTMIPEYENVGQFFNDSDLIEAG